MLYIVGDHDVVAADVDGAVARARALVPQLEAVVLAGLGHEAYALEPDRVVGEMVDFFDA